MEHTPHACKPAACLVNVQGGCARCQLSRSAVPDGQTFLLLGAQNARARESVARALDAANLPFQECGDVLAVPTRRARLSGFLVSLLEELPAATAEAVKGVFWQGGSDGVDMPRALAAFVRAEPVSVLLGDARHKWVRDALEDDWLTSFFHPIVEARTGLVFGYECLIRARNPHTDELIGAWPIIEAANTLKLDHVLDQHARRTAIRCASELDIEKVRYFINFLPNTIYDPEICLRTTMEAAQEFGLDPARLVFEVVETERIPDIARLRRILDYYRERGVGTAVDDMGSGFASLQYVTELQPDFVKLDRDLVVRAGHDVDARRTLDLIVGTAKEVGSLVIAEGIETPGQMTVSQEAVVDFLQGFLFARPANPPETARIGLHLEAGGLLLEAA